MNFLEFASRYAYLLCSATYAVVIVVLALRTITATQYRLMILSGIAGAPAFMFLIFFEEGYWSPARVGGTALGIEDVLISFAVAAMAWYMVASVIGSRLEARAGGRESLRRYLLAAISCDVAFLAAIRTGLDPMTSLLLTCTLAALLLWRHRPQNWRLAAAGAILFPPVWFLVVRVSFWLFPDFVRQWNLNGTWGAQIVGVPAGEIAWSVVFGAFWPLFTAYVFNVTYHAATERTPLRP